MTPLEIAENLLRLAKEATPGPWERRFLYEIYPGCSTKKQCEDNALYISAANPEAITELCQRLIKLENVADAARVIMETEECREDENCDCCVLSGALADLEEK